VFCSKAAHHSRQFNAVIKNDWSYTSTPPCRPLYIHTCQLTIHVYLTNPSQVAPKPSLSYQNTFLSQSDTKIPSWVWTIFRGADECSAVCRPVCAVATACVPFDTLSVNVAKLECLNRTLMGAKVQHDYTREDNLWAHRYFCSNTVNLSCLLDLWGFL